MKALINTGILAAMMAAGLSVSDIVAVAGSSVPIIDAARDGHIGTVGTLIESGADVNTRDNLGKTALHYAAENGHMGVVELLLKKGANVNTLDNDGHTALYYAEQKGHDGTAKLLRSTTSGQSLNPALKYPDLATFQAAIGEDACLLKGKHVYFFAPKRYESESSIILPYLVKAYDALRQITGVDTEYIIVVYNFPKGHPDISGGTSNCTLWYDDSNLQLDRQEEWKSHRIPHVSGYIEEMAHNFVSATKAQFGWEMIGWIIGIEVTAKVAGNPIHSRLVKETRQEQARTFQRYLALGFTFPNDLPANQVDRIHAHILWQCEQKYGPRFWPDFFGEIKKRRQELARAVQMGNDDAIRNERYRITVQCFDTLQGLHFKEVLKNARISATSDIKSLHPTNPGWNRKLQ